MHWNVSLKQKFSRVAGYLGGPHVRQFRFGYEKAGLQVADEPIPWNAEAVWVEAVVQLPSGRTWGKEDFHLQLPEYPPVIPALVAPTDRGQVVRVHFRLPPSSREVTAGLYGKGNLLGRVRLPFLSAEEFLRGLQLESPAVCANLGAYAVACRSVVEGQCRGYSAAAVLVSPTSLVPVLDLPVRVDFADTFTGAAESVTVPLTQAALLGNRAVLSVIPPCPPPWFGKSQVRWTVADRLLGQAEIRAISPEAFRRSLYLVESRCLTPGKGEPAGAGLGFPAAGDERGPRPRFVVASREPGVAGLCPLEVCVRFRNLGSRPLRLRQEVLVTDSPSPWVPDLDLADDPPIASFELYSEGELLGVLPISPAPVAAFTSEGGFHGLEDYHWTRHTDEELMSRLQKLMGVGCTQVEPFQPL